jgi:predicted nucleotidyltransferase
MLKRNGYVLEQLYSPLVVLTSSLHQELKVLGHGCITRHHVHHYRGFSHTQWEIFVKERPRRVKPLLYVFRVLLTGIHLLTSGRIECNLGILNQEARLPYLPELMSRKTGTREQATLDDADLALYQGEYHRLRQALEDAWERSTLPVEGSTRSELERVLVRARMQVDHP